MYLALGVKFQNEYVLSIGRSWKSSGRSFIYCISAGIEIYLSGKRASQVNSPCRSNSKLAKRIKIIHGLRVLKGLDPIKPAIGI